MKKVIIFYTILYLTCRPLFVFIPSEFTSSIMLLVIGYWILKNRKTFKEFSSSFKEDIKQGKLIYTFKQFFNLKRLLLGRIRHESISLESLDYKDINQIMFFNKEAYLRNYSPTLNQIKNNEDAKSFIEKSLIEYKDLSSLNFKITYINIFYIPCGPSLIENFVFRRIQRFYKNFEFKVEKKIIALPIIKFVDKEQKIIKIEWSFDENYERFQRKIFNKLLYLLFKKLNISKIFLNCFKEDLELQDILKEFKFKRIKKEEDYIKYYELKKEDYQMNKKERFNR